MTPRVARWLCVALLVTACGCSGLAGGGPGGATEPGPDHPTSTATAVPVPTDRPSLPPGVDDGGLDDPAALAAANERALATTAHRLTRTVQVAGGDNTVVVDREQRRTTDGRLVATLAVTGDGPVRPAVDARTRYREGDVVHERARLRDGRTVINRLPAAGNGTVLVGARLPRRLFAAGPFVVTGRTADGVVLRSQGTLNLTGAITPFRTADARVAVRAVVARDGLVRSLTVDAVVRTPDGRVPVRITQSVTPGPVTVDRPAWVETDR